MSFESLIQSRYQIFWSLQQKLKFWCKYVFRKLDQKDNHIFLRLEQILVFWWAYVFWKFTAIGISGFSKSSEKLVFSCTYVWRIIAIGISGFSKSPAEISDLMQVCLLKDYNKMDIRFFEFSKKSYYSDAKMSYERLKQTEYQLFRRLWIKRVFLCKYVFWKISTNGISDFSNSQQKLLFWCKNDLWKIKANGISVFSKTLY